MKKDPSSSRIVMVSGKGGVGKTTVAIGMAASTPGARLIQFDAPSGAEGFDVDRLVLGSDRCVQDVAADLLGSRSLARLLLSRPSVEALLSLSDAMRAIALMERIRQLSEEGRPLIIDMPATGHALSWFRSIRIFRELTQRGSAHDLVARIEQEVLHPSVLELWAVTVPSPVVMSETAEFCDTIRTEMGVAVRVLLNRDADPTVTAMPAACRLPVFDRVSYQGVAAHLLGVPACAA